MIKYIYLSTLLGTVLCGLISSAGYASQQKELVRSKSQPNISQNKKEVSQQLAGNKEVVVEKGLQSEIALAKIGKIEGKTIPEWTKITDATHNSNRDSWIDETPEYIAFIKAMIELRPYMSRQNNATLRDLNAEKCNKNLADCKARIAKAVRAYDAYKGPW